MLVGEAHQLDEAFAELMELATRLHQALGHIDIAVGRSGQCQRLLHVHAIAVGQILRHHGRRGLAQLDALTT